MADALRGKNILVVEDEYFIASDLKRAFSEQGAIVVGPVADLVGGLSLANAEAIDAAVLDVNLDSATSFTIADRLGERSVPFIFVTGYDDWALPRAYADAPRITKPFPMNSVVSMVGRLLSPAGAF